jgi:cobalamin biosynthesis protein CobT
MSAIKPRYKPEDLLPNDSVQGFNHEQHRADLQRKRYNPNQPVMPSAFDVRTLVSQQAVVAIRTAFTQAKTSHRAWKSIQREGRFDVRQAPRIHNGAQDVFKRKVGRSTTHVKVSILIDASGSMRGFGSAAIPHPDAPKRRIQVSRAAAAALFGATIATALGRVPTIDIDIFQHAAGSMLHLKYRWAKGTPVAVFNGAATQSIGPSGNADGHALFAITERMKREIKRDEKGIILVVSDGLPSQYASQNVTASPQERSAGQALIDAVAHARRAGFEVIAVAIDGSDQSVYYGEKGVVPFDGDWTALGKALGQHVGAALAVR